MKELKRADFAGSWYPGRESECRRTIDTFAESSLACPSRGDAIGGIVPHAGWTYSGKIACNVIQCLKHYSDPDTCIIFGRHLHSGSGNYILARGAYDTPLGDLDVDSELAEELMKEFNFNVETSLRYEPDNTIELQLPFIKYFYPDTRILPMGVPPKVTTLEIARRAAQISNDKGRKTIVLGSTDLTHYGYNYGYTPKGLGEEAVEWVKNTNDKRVVDLMLKMDGEGVIQESRKNQNACCSGAAGAAIAATKELGAQRAEKILYSTSYDIRPDSSFVGYVGIVFCV
jgi:AmmeMemoRadiSam system protein B